MHNWSVPSWFQCYEPLPILPTASGELSFSLLITNTLMYNMNRIITQNVQFFELNNLEVNQISITKLY
jgi:hypothetical protein